MLVAAEHHVSPVFRQVTYDGQDPVFRAKALVKEHQRPIAADRLLRSAGVVAGSDLDTNADGVAGVAAAVVADQEMQRPGGKLGCVRRLNTQCAVTTVDGPTSVPVSQCMTRGD